ncbi:hypothetical protein RchiOBHm_Chr5g0007661 [Rosa chinensis]|uniref:Uncharacterized protein n=1 Tax=Rosa chinensis TaxID=74649 RepID=A0A2P6Q3Z8_ROSCH|nr:hypothetical protein RchiOBHm_Chr5g0007661 [Rosa chinensis]
MVPGLQGDRASDFYGSLVSVVKVSGTIQVLRREKEKALFEITISCL